MRVEEVIIIGAGPAGIAAAIQLKRFGIKALIFEKDRIGGLLRNANRIENYPGFPEGISGIRFVERLEERVGGEKIVDHSLSRETGHYLRDLRHPG